MTGSVFDSQEFRKTLGHYPTGVTIVTGAGADGAPIGLTIGSFSSVSLDPPLVAFFPMRDSSTFETIRESGHFCVNILAEDQEDACRSFASRSGEKFGNLEWRRSPLGSPILDKSIAWIDCTIESVVAAGDHFIVTGRVHDFAVQRDLLPLLFFRGGYGSFQPRFLVTPSSSHVRALMRTVDVARESMEELAQDLGCGCLAVAIVGNEMMNLASVGGAPKHHVPAAVGTRVPWAPPLGMVFVAWGAESAIAHWLRQAPVPLSESQSSAIEEAVLRVRSRGYSIGLMSDSQLDFERAVSHASETPDADETRRIAELCSELIPFVEPSEVDAGGLHDVRHLGAPIFDADGHVVLDLVLVRLPRRMPGSEVGRYARALVDAADSITAEIGGRRPRSWISER